MALEELMESSNRIIILTGPSCAGKTPLKKALGRLYPEFFESLLPVVLYNSRRPRPGEKDGEDYHFRRRGFIDSLRDNDRYIVVEARGDLQALDTDEFGGLLEKGNPFYEGNPFVAGAILEDERLARVPRLSVYISPLSRDEIRYLSDPEKNADLPSMIAEMMRRKLLRRTSRHKGVISAVDLENVETRARSAWDELLLASKFDFVLPNHDGEDSDNWDAFHYPLGDARATLEAFVSLLEGEPSPLAERWGRHMFRRNSNG
jgi:guanylate kinase